MTIEELRRDYSEEELSYFPGDGELRYRLFAPLFADLHENKVVYRERFVAVVRLENIKITPEFFEATAAPLINIEFSGDWKPEPPAEPWTFGGVWSALCLLGSGISAPYAGWTIWPEPKLVPEVERLAQNGEFERALELTAYAEFRSEPE